MSTQRDLKRGACYNAEQHWAEGTLLGESQSFNSLVTQTKEIETTPEWQARWARPLLIGYNTGTRSWANSATNTISYIVSGTPRKTVPHEMAHIITPWDEGHGHEWRCAYVWVVRLAYGNEWADALADAFRTSKLSCDIWSLARTTPVFPPSLFEAQHGTPINPTTTPSARGPIAL